MKRKILFLTILGLGLILPLHQAKAIVPLVGAGIAAAVVYIGGWAMQALSLLTATGVAMWAAILQWVLGLDWPYTSGGIVAVGWPIVRDLANMLFVIILVFIGLAVALRLKDYEAKKTLPALVVIILLINFTPVIAGLIVDASNIVMNFFVEGLKPGAYYEAHMSAQRAIMPASIWKALNPFKEIEQLLGSLIIIAVDTVVQFIFMIFSLLFLVRYIAIWILVILSPIAFAAYILPATRGIWKMWWDQFLQWCIIGVTAGFFLYLGTMFMAKLNDVVPPASTEGVVGAINPANVLVNLMPLITVAIFYVIGFFVSLSTSAMGAKQITAGLKKGGKAAGKVVGFAAATGAWKTAKSIPAAGKAARQAYTIHRGLGQTRRQALGAALEREWAAVRLETTGELRAGAMTKKVSKGIWNTIKGAAIAGGTATLGIKTKKKGKSKKPCEVCGFGSQPGEFIAASADRCPRCRAELS